MHETKADAGDLLGDQFIMETAIMMIALEEFII